MRSRRLRVGAAAASEPWAAVVAGVVFAFSPARFFRMSQLHVNAVQWVPLGLAFQHAYLDGGRPRDLRFAVACLSAQALTSGHGAAFASVAYSIGTRRLPATAASAPRVTNGRFERYADFQTIGASRRSASSA